VRYRYYVSAPVLHGEAKTASAGSISRVPVADVEEAVTKSLKGHLAEQQNGSATNTTSVDGREAIAQLVAAIIVHKDKLIVRLKSDASDEASDNSGDRSLAIPWQKPPSKRCGKAAIPAQ
jgi:site-specific DNA recombinase